jgi:hypothetical protein
LRHSRTISSGWARSFASEARTEATRDGGIEAVNM